MKIAQVVCTYPPYRGGIGKSAQTFSRLLSSKHSLVTITPKYKSGLESSSQIKYLNPLLKYGNAALLPQIFKYLKNTEIIYFHYPFFGTDLIIWLYKLTRGKRKKMIIHYHMDTFKLSPLAKLLKIPSVLMFRSLLKKSDLITCFSLDYIKESQIASYYRKNPAKFKEIPLGVDTKKFFPSAQKPKSSRVKALFVGGLDKAHYFKGLDYLLEALALSPSYIILNIVGEGEEKRAFQEKAHTKGLKERINFYGSVSDSELPRIYRDHDFFVLPSIDKSEALGIVLLEALASGLPVISSQLPGVRKVFQEGEQGFSVPPKNIKKLKEKIIFLADNPELRKKMGKQARELAEKKYSPEALREKFNEILKKYENSNIE